MKKVKYKTIDVKQLNWTQIAEQFSGQKVIFSTDVAKHDFVAVLSDTAQDQQILLKWTHPQDTGYLLAQMERHLDLSQLQAVMESTGTYGDVLRWQLKQRGVSVYQVSSKHTHDQSETFDGVPSSHDAKAALIIADLHLRGRSHVWTDNADMQKDLRSLVNELDIHQQVHRGNLNRLSSLMMRHWPELEDLISLNTKSALRLLAEYGSPANIAQHLEEAEQLLCKTGGSGLKADKLEALLHSSQQTLGVPCSAGERLYIQQLAQDLLRTRQASQAVEQRIEKALELHAVSLTLTGFCGKVTSAVLFALLGDLRDYDNANSVLKAAGLNLKERSSGKHKGQLRITKRGSGKVRFYLYWLVLRLIRTDAHIKAWYDRKVKRDGGRHKGRALIAVMRKVVKALWHVARGATFDSQKLFNLTA